MIKKLSCVLALALTVTSLASCNMASGGDRSDELRVDREGGDYKHEYGDETETPPTTAESTTETTEEPTTTTTEEPTTTTTEQTSSYASQGVLHSMQEAVTVVSQTLGKDYDSGVAFLENSLGTKFTLVSSEKHSPEIDSYPDTLFEYEYDCNVVIYGFGYDAISIWCDEDNRIIEVSFCYNSSDKQMLMNYYDYFRADLSTIFGSPIEEDNDDEDVKYTTYGPMNNVSCTVTYMYWGEGEKYNMAILGFGLDR